jgi:6-pyruvoyltetrahydropterin/6-carboxytetrahydropterin synthase
MKIELRKTFQFEAAHRLPHLPKTHKCYRLHGHSFQAEIVVSGECDAKLGWLMDYADIAAAFKPLWDQLDHYCLNDVAGLENPTSENVAVWIWERLKPKLPQLTEVIIAETCQSRCVYRGDDSNSGTV